MVERIAIFNAKGFQLGYIEGDAAFDFNGTRRCNYAGATGNLCDLKNGNVVGHVSLDGIFVGAYWISHELLGRPNDDARADHLAGELVGAHQGSTRLSVQRPVNAAMRATASQRSDAAPGRPIHPNDPESLSTSDPVVDDKRAPPSAPSLISNAGAPEVMPSADENELLDRAMSMIRSALVKGNREVDP